MATNSKPAGTGLLANPYAHLLAAAGLPSDGASTDDASIQPKAEEKKPTVPAFHNPHLIKRPQAKSAKPARKPAPRPAVAMATSATDLPAAASEKPAFKLADFVNTAEEDAEIDGRRREENRQRKQQQKDLKKARKKLGDWKPYDPYKIRHPTKIGLFRVDAEMYPKVKMAFGDYLRKARGEEPRLGLLQSSDDSPEPARSRSTSPKATKAMFAPPTFTEPTDVPPAPAADLPQTVEEMLAKRAQLAGQRSVLPATSSPAPKPLSPVAEPLTTTPPARSPLLSPVSADETEPKPQAAINLAKLAQNKRIEEVKAQLRAKAAASKLAQKSASPAPTPPDQSAAAPPPPPPSSMPPQPTSLSPPPPPPPQPAYSATISAEPIHYARPPSPKAPYNPTISAEPVRYAVPVSVQTQKKPADEEPKDERPSKKRKHAPAAAAGPYRSTKAELMMAKMGWKKGEGLGKDSDGIVDPIMVDIKKTWGSDLQTAVVTGGQRNQETNQDRFGEPSRVVVSWGCVDGVNFGDDAEREDGGIRQEMGDLFSKKFGEVERIHVELAGTGRPVYIKFNDQLSALNAVNRFYEGYKFQDRVIRAEFYNEKKFNASIYEH